MGFKKIMLSKVLILQRKTCELALKKIRMSKFCKRLKTTFTMRNRLRSLNGMWIPRLFVQIKNCQSDSQIGAGLGFYDYCNEACSCSSMQETQRFVKGRAFNLLIPMGSAQTSHCPYEPSEILLRARSIK